MTRKIMIDIEATLNKKILVTKIIPHTKGIIGFITPRTEPEKRSFENYNEFSEWLKQELGGL